MSGRRRMLAGLAGAALLVGLAVAPPVQTTDAAFTDPENAGATFTAGTISPLTDVTCQIRGGLTFTGVTLSWKSAYDMSGISDPAYSPISGTNAAGATSYVNRSIIAKSGPVSGRYTYTAILDAGLLGGLLGTLLGATSTLTIQERYPVDGSQWVTPPKSFRLTVALGGLLGTSCTPSP